MSSTDFIVLWEYEQENDWKPLEPKISNFIENIFRNSSKSSSCNIPQMIPQLNNCFLDLAGLQLIKKFLYYNKSFQIRRSLYSLADTTKQAVIWHWQEDGGRAESKGFLFTDNDWVPYKFEVSCYIENNYQNKTSAVDLQQIENSLPYILDLTSLFQIRKNTCFRRKITRKYFSEKYLNFDFSSVPSTSGSVSNQMTSTNNFFQANLNNMFLDPNIPFGTSQKQTHLFNQQLQPSWQFQQMQVQSPQVMLQPHSNAHVHLQQTLGSQYVQQNQQQQFIQQNQNQQQQFLIQNQNQSQQQVIQQQQNKPLLDPAILNLLSQFPFPPNTPIYHISHAHNSYDNLLSQKLILPVKTFIDDDCPICLENLSEPSLYPPMGNMKEEKVVMLAKCKHLFHSNCVRAMHKNQNNNGCLQCPKCKTISGVKLGNCPHGFMTFSFFTGSLPGHEPYKTITIIYNISAGIQTSEHPSPGQRFTARGFPRHAYLPCTEKGIKALLLLITAWQRRLVFTIGTSVTTGETNTVVWNEIHHKTEFKNEFGHGYPDPNYLDNLLLELSSQGVE